MCRYETSVLQAHPKKDWTAAAKHYRLAMTVYPSGEQLLGIRRLLSMYSMLAQQSGYVECSHKQATTASIAARVQSSWLSIPKLHLCLHRKLSPVTGHGCMDLWTVLILRLLLPIWL